MGKFIKFDTLVRDICSAMGDDNASRHYLRVSRQLRRTLEMMNLNVYQTYETKNLEIGPNLTIALPDDVMEVQKVGVVWDGELYVMGYNDKLRRSAESLESACTCGGTSTTTTTTEETTSVDSANSTLSACPVCCFQNVWWDGRMYGEMYGRRPDKFQNGTYRWDRNTNTLEFGTGYDIAAGDSVWVEYKKSLDRSDYDEIPAETYFCLLFYIQYILNASQSNPALANYQMMEFRRHYHQLKTFYQRRNLEDYMAAVANNFTASVKK